MDPQPWLGKPRWDARARLRRGGLYAHPVGGLGDGQCGGHGRGYGGEHGEGHGDRDVALRIGAAMISDWP